MKTLIGFCGRLGVGKNFCMNKMVDELKDTGSTIYLISFADPIKKILSDSFGLTKKGKIETPLPAINEIYVRGQVIDSMYALIKELNYEKFDISEHDAKAYIARNYEKYATEFYKYVHNCTLDIRETKIDYNYGFRRLGQMLGTELGRHLIDSIWVDIALDKVKKVFRQELADYAFIPDCRFINEYDRLMDFSKSTAFDSKLYGVTASDETRATRRGLSMEDLKAQDNHSSETSIDELIAKLPPEFVIQND
jgi:hypothetical protein